MNLDEIDWQALERLRSAFLDGTAGLADYWQTESDLASYDATFAQRIGWKWDYVLAELTRRGWTPPQGALLDWGCGSGIAHRAFLDHFGVKAVTDVNLWDRSPLAMNFSMTRARGKYPGLKVFAGNHSPALSPSGGENGVAAHPGISEAPGGGGTQNRTLLVSHVLSELTPEETETLIKLVERATATIWVEPGHYESSLALIAVRERLRGRLNVVAPCTHAAGCGILAPGNERHWCHHFAPSPPEVFTDGNWARFANLVGVDLGSLPVSFLVFDQRPLPSLAEGAMRMIGFPRVHKPHALLLGCDATGVAERRLTKRRLPEEYRRCKKGEFDVLQVWQCQDDEVISISPCYPPTGNKPDGGKP